MALQFSIFSEGSVASRYGVAEIGDLVNFEEVHFYG